MVKVHVEMPSGEVRTWSYPLGASIVADRQALVIYQRNKGQAIAVFSLARVISAEVGDETE